MQKQSIRSKLQHKEEIKRIREFYGMIAFAQSHSGKIVRSAMATSKDAGNIIRDMTCLFKDSSWILCPDF